MNEKIHSHRNLNPTAEAIAAMYLYGYEYSMQRGGSMDFWDCLSDSKKRLCIELVIKIKSVLSKPMTAEDMKTMHAYELGIVS